MQFMNERANLVAQSSDGMLRLRAGEGIARLGGPHNVVLNTKHKGNANVALVSGGGSGHEPSHAGFVGEGMLAAAVCGDVFASPSVDAVLAGIMSVTGKAGCLLIVKNYTGDRLNFGLAAEKARALGKKVEMVIVADDVSIPRHRQPRGLAATLFVHKIAGYLAASGASLDAVSKTARDVAASAVSLGISLSSCTLPGIGREDRVPDGKAELGLGIHGEPGVDLIAFKDARQAARLVASKLMACAPKAKSYALLLNNLGSTTPLEMGVIAREFLLAPGSQNIKLCVGPAPLMTALDMHGFSASLLPLNPVFEKGLRAATGPTAWTPAAGVKPVLEVKPAATGKQAARKASKNAAASAAIEAACDAMLAQEKHLNALDAKVGDGDTGTTIATAAREIKSALNKLPLADQAGTLAALSDIFSRSMGGSSGVLMAIMFAAAGKARADGSPLSEAFAAGLERVQHYGGAKLGDRTMIDALQPALAALTGGQGLSSAALAARKGADKTATMAKAGAGRSAHVAGAKLAGNIDPGAEAVAQLFAVLRNRITG
jgi:triose/dihydroxyacetone kinase / FAD-AMP lyase (cyclizing)